MKKNGNSIIKCPQCGAEYLPAEIYLPKSFLGTPKDIEKSSTGIINFYDGEDMDLRESYICDVCGTQFNVYAKVEFRVSANEKRNINSEYKTKLFPDKLTLREE